VSVAGGSVLILCSAHGKADIATPQVRSASIVAAEAVLGPRDFKHKADASDILNPFAPARAVVKAEAAPVARPSDQEFINTLAAQLSPTGALQMGGQAFLLFGEKKVKVGEFIPINFDNETYEVELLDLTRTAFTVRLNNVQTTRSIKPAKTP
jgi:hypothetical protein